MPAILLNCSYAPYFCATSYSSPSVRLRYCPGVATLRHSTMFGNWSGFSYRLRSTPITKRGEKWLLI